MLVTHGDGHDGELVGCHAGWEDVALLGAVESGAGNGSVDCLASGIIDESQCGAGVCDSGVSGASDRFAVHSGRGTVEHPEPLRAVDGGVVRFRDVGGGQHVLIDITKSIEGNAFVRVARITPGAKVGGENSGFDVVLRNHILNRCVGGGWSDGVDRAEGQA